MSLLAFNGNSAPLDPALQTWQDLLEDLESRQLGNDEVITSVQFDGDEIEHFRDESALALQLKTVDEVRIVAMGRREMLQSALRDAETHLEALETGVVEVADLFRTQQLNQANSCLHQVLSGIKMYVALIRGIDLSLTGLPKPNADIDKLCEPLVLTLEDQIKAQAQQDWALVADILEYELANHLTAFHGVLETFKSAVGAA